MCFEEWMEQFPAKEFPKNTRLFLQGDPLDYCFYLKQGICSQMINYENGIEVVAKYYFPGDLLNIWGVLKQKNAYASTTVAKTDAYGIMIPATAMRRELDQNFSFYRWIVESVLNKNQYVYQQYQKKSKGSTAEILCYAILGLSQEDSNGRIYLSKDFSFCDLAQHLRIHRVSVSHVFKFLQENHVIQKCNRGWRILDVHALQEYAQGNRIVDPHTSQAGEGRKSDA